MNRWFCRTVLAVIALLSPAIAAAGEITLWEGEDFVGRSMTLRGPAVNLADFGFNDRAMSVLVRSGSWEICTDVGYRGNCRTLTPGEYRRLGPMFRDRVSSTREVGFSGQVVGPNRPGRNQIEFFDGRDFTGRSVSVVDEIRNLEAMRFNDRAESLIVHSGVWEVCEHADFQGICRIYGPGRYPVLERGLHREVTSARLTRTTPVAPLPPVVGPGPGFGPGRIDLFDNPGFVGEAVSVTGDARNLESFGFNDRAASAIVYSGMWDLCEHADYQGACRRFGPGRYTDIADLTGRLSSLRQVRGGPPGLVPVPDTGYRSSITVYEGREFRGESRTLNGAIEDFGAVGFNDRMSSIVVQSGTWELCTDAFFRGQCHVFRPGEYPQLPPGTSNRYSSARPVSGGGGAAPGPRPGLELFQFGGLRGQSVAVWESTPNHDGRAWPFRARSVVITEGFWELCTGGGFSGSCQALGPGRYDQLPGDVVSARRVR